jgi:hypothetical protein
MLLGSRVAPPHSRYGFRQPNRLFLDNPIGYTE